MKKVWIIIIAVIVAAAAFYSVANGSLGNEGIKGHWTMKSSTGVAREGTILDNWKYDYREFGALHVSFNDSGIGSYYVIGASRTYNTDFFYTVEGDTIIYKKHEDSLGQRVKYSFENGNLILTQEEHSITFVREK